VAVSVFGCVEPAQDTTPIAADNEPIWGDTVRTVEELRIGGSDTPPEHRSVGITALAIRNDGTIYAYDPYGPAIRQYDSRGTFVRTIGEPGSGPGQHLQVMGLRCTPDGRLVILDTMNGRITVYDSTGTYAEHHRVDAPPLSIEALVIDTAGDYYVKTIDRSATAARGAAATDDPSLMYVRLSAKSSVLDTLSLPLRDATPSFALSTPGGFRSNFPDETLYALSPTGALVVGHTQRYVLDVRLPDGTVRQVARDAEPVPLATAERDQWSAWSKAVAASQQRAAPYPEPPETKPLFRALAVDHEDRIWVQRYVPAIKQNVPPRSPGDNTPLYEWHEPPVFDVIGMDGTFFGTVVLPMDTYVFAHRGTTVWGMQAIGAQRHIVRLRLHISSS
jgi:hypothetical protein